MNVFLQISVKLQVLIILMFLSSFMSNSKTIVLYIVEIVKLIVLFNFAEGGPASQEMASLDAPDISSLSSDNIDSTDDLVPSLQVGY